MTKTTSVDTVDLNASDTRRSREPEAIQEDYALHLKYSLARNRYTASGNELYHALALSVRDRLVDRWGETQQAHFDEKVKRVYYLSLEFLIGRAMVNNVINLQVEDGVRGALAQLGVSWDELKEEEEDAGLGNGGLGRLAACFMDSLATLQIPSMGYGLRYDYGIFRQRIENGHQVEQPDDWLTPGNPWEIVRLRNRHTVRFGGHVECVQENGHVSHRWVNTHNVVGIPYDTPIVGYGGATVNTLRLWSARASEDFDFSDFNQGDYQAAVESKTQAENLTKVLYPNDHFYAGQELRLRQQYFFVCCSLHDILRRFMRDAAVGPASRPAGSNDGGSTGVPAGRAAVDWQLLPRKVAVQLNDTHPSLAIPEMMRVLVDEQGLDWDQAWELTVSSMGYTNHTLLPEALEKWPVEMMERQLPRHLQIIYEINRRFLQTVSVRFPGDAARQQRMSLIEETPKRQVRMANLSMVGSHSTNGVAALHTELLKAQVVPDFYEMFPERFNNKTNGITPRRWLMLANPPLAKLISHYIGTGWVTDLFQLRKLAQLAENEDFRAKFREVKGQAKRVLVDHMKAEFGMEANPDTLFDVQVKRLHEYKRQLLNALHIVVLYNRIRKNPNASVVPRTFLFGAKAAPGYHMAKLIIKFINNLGAVINRDSDVAGRLQVFFLPNYRVSLAEKIIPAADVSEQISLAGLEASGTGNMKFMLNGALTVGTLDGANVEMQEEVGQENIFIFGLTAQQVAESKGYYNPYWHYERDVETREALDLIFSGHFNPGEPGIFAPLKGVLLDHGDRYMHLADLPAYCATHQRVDELYRDYQAWSRKAVLNIAYSGKFSSDRTIQDYAREIWDIQPALQDQGKRRAMTMIMARGDGVLKR